jgi:hypothetical protein
MNRQHLSYFLVAIVVTAIAAIAVGGLIVSLLPGLAGAAYVAGWWTNLAVAGCVAILAGRKVASIYEEPRQGRIAGGAVGLWVGLGSALGQLAYHAFTNLVYQVDVKLGLTMVFMLVSFIVSIISATIAGRETAHPPEEEEA